MIRICVVLALACIGVKAAGMDEVNPEWIVNSTLDLPDATPLGDGIVDADLSLPGQQITLRAAIMETNAFPGIDAIRIPPGIYPLTLKPAVEFDGAAANGDLDVTDQLIIYRHPNDADGPVIIDAKKVDDRAFRVIGAYVFLGHIEIRNGRCDGNGGGIVGEKGANIALSGSIVKNCRAGESGGAIAVKDGFLSLHGSIVKNCRAGSHGGGIAFENGELDLEAGSVVKNCRAGSHGGGIAVQNAHVRITDTSFVKNVAAQDGGGAMLDGCVVEWMVQSQFIRNKAKEEGGGLNISSSTGLAWILRSTFSRNSAGVEGGGMQAESADTIMSNCTFHRNFAKTRGGGVFYRGNGNQTWLSSTLVGNKAPVGSGIGEDDDSIRSLTVANTILANGKKTNYSGAGITSQGHNIETGSSCGFDGPGDMPNTDPRLATKLKDNGGPTLTVALLAGSPAIDAGDDTTALPTDQRLLLRVDQGGVGTSVSDIGAFEVQ